MASKAFRKTVKDYIGGKGWMGDLILIKLNSLCGDVSVMPADPYV